MDFHVPLDILPIFNGFHVIASFVWVRSALRVRYTDYKYIKKIPRSYVFSQIRNTHTDLAVVHTTCQWGLTEICHRPTCERSIKAVLPGHPFCFQLFHSTKIKVLWNTSGCSTTAPLAVGRAVFISSLQTRSIRHNARKYPSPHSAVTQEACLSFHPQLRNNFICPLAVDRHRRPDHDAAWL